MQNQNRLCALCSWSAAVEVVVYYKCYKCRRICTRCISVQQGIRKRFSLLLDLEKKMQNNLFLGGVLLSVSSCAGAYSEHASIDGTFNSVPAALGGVAGWCRQTDKCWPTKRKIKELGKSCDGAVRTLRDGMQFINGVHVKNLRFNSTLPGILVEAESLGDVQRALSFAKLYNIRLVVVDSLLPPGLPGLTTPPSSSLLYPLLLWELDTNPANILTLSCTCIVMSQVGSAVDWT